MKEPTYPAARAVAPVVEAAFACHLSAAREQGTEGLAHLPDAASIEAIIDAGFWASLRREEGRSPTISLAFLPPDQALQPLLLARPIPLDPGALTRLAPAVERPGVHLGVWHGEEGLCVWGATRSTPCFCFVLEVVAPGLLLIKYRRDEGFGKFGNVAVLEGDQIKLVDERRPRLPEGLPLGALLNGFDAPALRGDVQDVLVRFALSMRAHGHGGALLLVPEGSEQWRESIVPPITYQARTPFPGLAELVRQQADEEARGGRQEALRRMIDGLAGLTAVDGATLMNERFELLAFGAKIGRREGFSTAERVILTEPVEGSGARVLHAVEVGGTRHLSAMQFVHDQQDAIALVASQDGRFTVFAWSPAEESVRAHRVETLLL